MSYERDMSIDVTALDVEWAEQAELAMKYGRLWAEAQDACSKAEEQVKFVRSQLVNKALKYPEKYLGKGISTSDSHIEAFYRTHELYLAAKDDWLEKLNELNLVAIAKSEICFTRKSALENLVTLHGQNYFAGPDVPRNLSDEFKKRKELKKAKNTSDNKKIRRIKRES